MSEEKRPQNPVESALLEFFTKKQNLPDLFDDDDDVENIWDEMKYVSRKGDSVLETYMPGFQLSVSKDIVLGYQCDPKVRNVELNDDPAGDSAMARCRSLAGEAFKGCNALRSVHLTRKNLMLGAHCFADCRNLQQVTLGLLPEMTLHCMFSGCRSLTSVSLPEGLEAVGMAAFESCGALREIRLPDTVREIGLGAFFGCEKLEEVRLPSNLISLQDDAFANCTSLRSVQLPESLRELGDCAFINCVSLEEIRIPEGVTKISFGAFCGCTGLKRILLPASVTEIDPYAFYRCDGLEEVEHPNVDRFGAALCRTDFWKKRHPNYIRRSQVPMDLLNHIGGTVDGGALCARGYTGFLCDRSYRIMTTRYPDVWEVRELSTDDEGEEAVSRNYYLMDGNLKPIAGVEPMLDVTHKLMSQHWKDWEEQKMKASQIVSEKLLLG